MAIDAGIFGQVGQGVRSVQDYDRMALDAQNAQLGQQQNRLALLLNQQKADEYQRGIQEQNRLRGLAQGWGADTTDEQRIAGLKNAGFFQQADSLEKGMLERQKTGASVAETNAKTQTADYELRRKKFEHTVQGLSQFDGNPESMRQWLADSVRSGAMDMQQATRMMQSLATAQDPKKWAQDGIFALMDAGKQAGFIRPDANTVANNATSAANAKLSADTSIANNKATVGLGYANLAETKRQHAAVNDRPQYMQTDAGLVALPTKLAPGQVPTGTVVMGVNGEQLGKPLKDIPASANTAIISNNQALNQLDRALTLVNGKDIGDPSKGGMAGDSAATGVKGYLPNGMLNRIDPKGVSARAEIADIGSLKLHDRSGANVTVSESPRLIPFIPLSTDDNATIVKKLTRLRLEVANEQQALADTYSKDQGYKPSPVKASATGSAGPQAGSVEGGYRFKGGDPANKANWEKV